MYSGGTVSAVFQAERSLDKEEARGSGTAPCFQAISTAAVLIASTPFHGRGLGFQSILTATATERIRISGGHGRFLCTRVTQIPRSGPVLRVSKFKEGTLHFQRAAGIHTLERIIRPSVDALL